MIAGGRTTWTPATDSVELISLDESHPIPECLLPPSRLPVEIANGAGTTVGNGKTFSKPITTYKCLFLCRLDSIDLRRGHLQVAIR